MFRSPFRALAIALLAFAVCVAPALAQYAPVYANYSNIFTTQALGANGVYTAGWTDATNMGPRALEVSVVASSAGSFVIQQSDDTSNASLTNTVACGTSSASCTNGTYTVPASTVESATVYISAHFYRVVYTNGATAQTSFELAATASIYGGTSGSSGGGGGCSSPCTVAQGTAANLLGTMYQGGTWNVGVASIPFLPATAPSSVTVNITTATTTLIGPASASSAKTWFLWLSAKSAISETVTLETSASSSCTSPTTLALDPIVPGSNPLFDSLYVIAANTYLCAVTSAAGQVSIVTSYGQQ